MASLRPAWVGRQILTAEGRREVALAPVPLVQVQRAVPWSRGGWNVQVGTDDRHSFDVSVLGAPDPITGLRRALAEVTV